MTERIKITGNMLYNTTLGNNMGVFIETHNIEESNKLIKQILNDQKTIDHFKKRWEKINVDLDAPEDCVKMCITLAHYFRDGSLYD